MKGIAMGRTLRIGILLICLMVISSAARAESESEIWDLSAEGHVYFDNAVLPNEVYGLLQDYDFTMGDDITVTLSRNGNSWTLISASGLDSNSNPYDLNGINGLFSISGFGITPGFGPVTTDYSPDMYEIADLTGTFFGSKIWENFPGPNGTYSGNAQWSGTFEVSRTNATVTPEPVSCALFLVGGGALALARRRKMI